MEINVQIRGIDVCSSEIVCLPEVFGQVFRYLSDIVVVCKETRRHKRQARYKTRSLYMTYHAGEDFFDKN